MPLATGTAAAATVTVSLPRAPGAVAGQGGVATCSVSRIEATHVYAAACTATNVKFLDDSGTVWESSQNGPPVAGTRSDIWCFPVPKRSKGANPRVVINNNATSATSVTLAVEYALEP